MTATLRLLRELSEKNLRAWSNRVRTGIVRTAESNSRASSDAAGAVPENRQIPSRPALIRRATVQIISGHFILHRSGHAPDYLASPVTGAGKGARSGLPRMLLFCLQRVFQC